jgi:hypothetical protein
MAAGWGPKQILPVDFFLVKDELFGLRGICVIMLCIRHDN